MGGCPGGVWRSPALGKLPCLGEGRFLSPKPALLRHPATDRSQGQATVPPGGERRGTDPRPGEPLLFLHSSLGSVPPAQPGALGSGEKREGGGGFQKSISFRCDFHSLASPVPPFPPGPRPALGSGGFSF